MFLNSNGSLNRLMFNTTFSTTVLLSQNVSGAPEWTSTNRFSLFILLGALVTNSGVLFLFCRDVSLVTPFTTYVLNLLFANLSRTLISSPLQLVNDLYGTWWTGWTSCTFTLYGTWVVEAAMCNAHMLITLNRLWAITFPHSYRRKHTSRFAVSICVIMWLYVNAGLLPGLIMDAMWYRKPLDTDGCLLNTDAQKTWSLITQSPYYAVPLLVVIVAYPFVCYKLWRTSHPRVSPASRSVQSAAANSRAVEKTSNKGQSHEVMKTGRARKKERNTSAFLILTVMTLALLVCYGPSQAYYVAEVYWSWDIPNMYPIQSALYELTAVLDPLLFALAITDLRRAFRKVYCCGY